MPISDKMLAAAFSLPFGDDLATTWEERANSALGAQLGLPPLSYIQLSSGRTWINWTAVKQWVAANPLRPAIWVDDDPLIRRCSKWLRSPQPNSLLINPEKAVGGSPDHLAAMLILLGTVSTRRG